MAAKPGSLPRIATTAGRVLELPESGTTTHSKDNGWKEGKRLPARMLNWFDNLVYQWCAYLDDIENHGQNWTREHTFIPSTANTRGIYVEGTGTGFALEAVGTGTAQATIRARGTGTFGAGIWATGVGTAAGGRFDGGSGGGPGVLSTGAGSGPGVEAHGSTGGSIGVLGAGTGANSGGWFSSASGPGVTATGASSSAGVVGSGGTGTGPGVSGTGGSGGAPGVSGTGTGTFAGVLGTGVGSGPGMRAVGGNTAGTGLVAIGGTSGDAITATANGSGVGIIATGGATGRGGAFTGGGGAPAVDVGAGHLQFTGTPPTKHANPGRDDLVTGANICQARGYYVYTSGGTSESDRLKDGYNIASVVTVGSLVTVNFARPMADANYTLNIQVNTPFTGTTAMRYIDVTKSDTGFEVTLKLLDLTDGSQSTTSWSGSIGFDFTVFGRQ